MSRPLCVGGDISLTKSGLAWPDGVVLTHGRSGLANPRTPLQERGQALMGLTWELGSLVGFKALSASAMGPFDILGDPAWPALVVMENLPTNGTGADVQSERCYVWWSLINLLNRQGVPVLEVTPTQLKVYACGMGNANKREVWAGVAEHFPQYEIHQTGKRGNVLTTPDFDKADAVTLMAMGCDLLGAPLVELPQKHRRALDALELPPGVKL